MKIEEIIKFKIQEVLPYLDIEQQKAIAYRLGANMHDVGQLQVLAMVENELNNLKEKEAYGNYLEIIRLHVESIFIGQYEEHEKSKSKLTGEASNVLDS